MENQKPTDLASRIKAGQMVKDMVTHHAKFLDDIREVKVDKYLNSNKQNILIVSKLTNTPKLLM